MASFNLNYLLKALCPNTVTLEFGTLTWIWWGPNSIHRRWQGGVKDSSSSLAWVPGWTGAIPCHKEHKKRNNGWFWWEQQQVQSGTQWTWTLCGTPGFGCPKAAAWMCVALSTQIRAGDPNLSMVSEHIRLNPREQRRKPEENGWRSKAIRTPAFKDF